MALLIGNSKYDLAPLIAPASDVQNLEVALTSIGFRVVKGTDADQLEMRRLIRDFGAASHGAEVAFFYYSGHGVQVDGENYLVPVKAAIGRPSDVAMEAISVSAIVDQVVGARPKAAIFVLDACRDNPLATTTTKSLKKGLARMYGASGTMIAFATAPNATAPDDGTYARVLASQVTKPSQELYDVFRNTSAEVMRISLGRQEPRISDVSITEKLYLAGNAGVAQQSTITPGAAPAREPSPPVTGANPYLKRVSSGVVIELLGIADRRFTNNVGFADGALIATFAVHNEGRDPIAVGLGSRESFCADFKITDGRGGYCPACANGEVLSSLPAVRSGDNADRLTTIAAQSSDQHVINFHAGRCRSRITDASKLSIGGTFLVLENGALTTAPISFSDIRAIKP